MRDILYKKWEKIEMEEGRLEDTLKWDSSQSDLENFSPETREYGFCWDNFLKSFNDDQDVTEDFIL